jgi:hypothetical protein
MDLQETEQQNTNVGDEEVTPPSLHVGFKQEKGKKEVKAHGPRSLAQGVGAGAAGPGSTGAVEAGFSGLGPVPQVGQGSQWGQNTPATR